MSIFDRPIGSRVIRFLLLYLTFFVWLTVLSGASAGNPRKTILCVGDSITYGFGVAEHYPSRLATRTGTDHTVINAGINGESAAQLRNRIGSVMANYQPTHVAILIGTNDVMWWNNLDQAADHIIEIARQVQAFGAVPVVGTVPPVIGQASGRAARVQYLNDRIWANRIAGDYLVAEVGNAFGSGAGLMQADGFHPNDVGMQVIANTFFNRLGPFLPGAPSPVSPSGIILRAFPMEFSWQPAVRATWYYVSIERDSVPVFSTWTQNLSLDFDQGLSCDYHRWRVRSWNSTGYGPWSAYHDLIFQDGTCFIPDRPVLEETTVVGDGSITYAWNVVEGETGYEIWINRRGSKWAGGWIEPEIVEGVARVTLENHGFDDYRWWVRSRSDDGVGPWSLPSDFPYGEVHPLSPSGALGVADFLPLSWRNVDTDDAVAYHIWINREGETFWDALVPAEDTALIPGDGWVREFSPTLPPMPYGTYRWWVRPLDNAGNGIWSLAAEATVGLPGGLAASGLENRNGVRLSWNDDPTRDALYYEVWIHRNGRLWWNQWVAVEETDGGEGGSRSYAIPSALPSGNYRFWVRAWNPQGTGPWSQPGNFVVALGVPAKIDGLGGEAVGDRSSHDLRRPSFEWTAVADCPWVEVYIQRNGTLYQRLWVEQSQWMPAVDLPPGQYRWWVRGWNVDGLGEWSEHQDFYINLRVPGIPVPESPQGDIFTNFPDFTWTPGEHAAWQQLWIHRNGAYWAAPWVEGEGVDQWAVDAYLPEGDYRWWIRSWNPDGLSEWSSPLEFSMVPPEIVNGEIY